MVKLSRAENVGNDRGIKMNARWDIFLPAAFVFAFAAFFFILGYYEGMKRERDKQLIVADFYRVKQAQAKQLYDWETHGI
jgi:hypothetical protein